MGDYFLKNKKVLITAGPTWVPVDDVRVLSNISSGQMGLFLAEESVRLGFKTDLFLGPVGGNVAFSESLKIFRFCYFHELLSLIKKILTVKKYDVIIHCAAVSDYICANNRGKISSEKETLVLKFKKAPKLVHLIRRLNPHALLVMFKLESGLTQKEYFRRALSALKKAEADMVVANYFKGASYRGSIVDHQGHVVSKAFSKKKLAKNLFEAIKKRVER
ncbi:MAG: phosphopantothenoylcysteine decarboxylase [Candidatus Omnitrophota bacterium]